MNEFTLTFQDWDDPLASDGPCPWGGLGNYVLLDENCDWECSFREACKQIKQRAQRQRLREQIIAEVNEHRCFITAWRIFSFSERCLLEKRGKKRGAANIGGLKVNITAEEVSQDEHQ